ncbi:MAG: hypothetical protein SX243_22440 [Acidobacteriota bacterium]|nr:hypothetical protein [Acidobacteriota bacterium]
MTERKQYTEDQLEMIADAIWGTGTFHHGASLYNTPCPVCGADIRLYVDGTSRRPPPRFRAICSVCGIDSSGKATTVEMRSLTEEEINDLLELHLHGQPTACPACHSPLQVEELPISGRGSRHFQIKCLRCGTRGQKRWSPHGEERQ